MSHEEAATVPFGGLDALHFLKKGELQPGQTVVINGAGGSIGTFAVQLAKHFGAEVTAVDSAGKLEMLRAIGADHIIDFAQQDFTRSGERYDVIFDVVGKSPYSRSLKSLKDHGSLWRSGCRDDPSGLHDGMAEVVFQAAARRPKTCSPQELIEAGKLRRSQTGVIAEQVIEAHRM
jgi:NADPH:quinone reductase-like Zn-dependent oxidoreductase